MLTSVILRLLKRLIHCQASICEMAQITWTVGPTPRNSNLIMLLKVSNILLVNVTDRIELLRALRQFPLSKENPYNHGKIFFSIL